MSVKLTDVADKAGVSIATVSRAIRRGYENSSPSSQKVLKIAKEMGYEPNRIRKPKGIGNILLATIQRNHIDKLEDPIYTASDFYGPFLYNVEREIRNLRGTLTICQAMQGVDDITTCIQQAFRDSNCRGIIALRIVKHTDIEFLRQLSPLVCLNPVQGITNVDSVCPDDEGGVRQVVRRLVELGHRRIAFWADRDSTGRIINHTAVRLRGYQSELEETGLTYSRVYGEEICSEPLFERMERGFQKYLEDSERPTAIVCTGDLFAHHVVQLAQKHGIDVPGDLSIFGFDDTELCVHFKPQLSSVNIQRGWMSREAVRLMKARLDKSKNPPCQVTIQAQVIERETSGPAPK